MDTKNVPSISVEETEESTSSTSLIYNLKEGKWQKSLINDSNDSTSDSECESEEQVHIIYYKNIFFKFYETFTFSYKTLHI